MVTCRKCNQPLPPGANVCPHDGWTVAMEQAGTYAAGLAGGVGASAASAQPQPELPPTGELVPGYMVGEYRIDMKLARWDPDDAG